MKHLARVLFCALMATLLTAASSHQVNYGTNQDITEFSTCKNVANASSTGKALFVPTNTSTEWSTFYGHAPAGVTISACAPTCGGKSLGGYCWYLGPTSGSCTTACASHGGVVTAGIVNYAGSSGTDANCTAVAHLFYPTYTFSASGGSGTQPIGCAVVVGFSYIARFHGSTTTAAGSYGSDTRLCSCAN